MFLETNHNRTVYTQQICLPCVLNAVNYRYGQEDIDCPYGRMIHQFIWVEEGALRMTLDDHTCILRPGQGAFIPAHMPHSYVQYGDELPVTAWFSFFGLDGVLAFYEVRSWLLFEVPPFLPAACRQLDERCNNNSDPVQRSLAAYSLVNELLSDLLSDHFSLVHQVDNYLENHFSRPLTLDDVAAAMHMNRYTLCHHYKQDSSSSIMETLLRIRIAKAKQYLQTTALPITEISNTCGFSDPSYFGKMFRRTVGCSPREYRSRKRQPPAAINR